MYIYNGHQLLFYTLISLGTVVLAFVLTCIFAVPKELRVEENNVIA